MHRSPHTALPDQSASPSAGIDLTQAIQGNFVSKFVYHTVTLGAGGYGNTLTVTGSGGVLPVYQSGYASAGIAATSNLAGAYVLNQGRIYGAAGSKVIDGINRHAAYGTQGGTGVYLGNVSSARLVNQGAITGGNGTCAFEYNDRGGDGGTGVMLGTSDSLTNSGKIFGGDGGYSYNGQSGNGGIGVELSAFGTLQNSGNIYGGVASLKDPGAYAAAGIGVYTGTGGVVNNSGLIIGGYGQATSQNYGVTGGNGADIVQGSTLTNSGVVAGGTGGTAQAVGGAGGIGVYLASGAVLSNTSRIEGGAGGSSYAGFGGAGGAGVYFAGGGSASNTGTIIGGTGGGGYGQAGGSGGAGVRLNGGGAHLSNAGLIEGGSGADQRYDNSGPGGTGVAMYGTTTLANTGAILGGNGGSYYDAIYDHGGTGVLLSSGASATSSGLIEGGAGGRNDDQGAAGGVGVDISGAKLSNSGTILVGAGGAVGNDVPYGGVGGAGVYLDGGTLINSGLIEGGAGGGGDNGSGANGDAVQFGNFNAATLVLEKGARFIGQVVASIHLADTLELGGTAAGTLSGLGTEFVNFAKITEDAGAHWTLTGHNTLTSLAGHTALLTGASGEKLTNTGTLSGNGAGNETVSLGLINTGLVSASGGTMNFLGSVSNTGTMNVASGLLDFTQTVGGKAGLLDIGATGTLALQAGAASGQMVDFLAGTGLLELTKPNSFLGNIEGFTSHDRIELVGTVETGFKFSGGVLSVTNGATTVARLHFDGSYSTASFTIAGDGHGNSFVTLK
jgi:hypothetical protein